MMVGRLLSFWQGNFSGAMLNFRWVYVIWHEVIQPCQCFYSRFPAVPKTSSEIPLWIQPRRNKKMFSREILVDSKLNMFFLHPARWIEPISYLWVLHFWIFVIFCLFLRGICYFSFICICISTVLMYCVYINIYIYVDKFWYILGQVMSSSLMVSSLKSPWLDNRILHDVIPTGIGLISC